MNRSLAIVNDISDLRYPAFGYEVPKDAHSGLVKRDELARQLIAMYTQAAPNLARAEIEEFDNLFNDLTDAISGQTRTFLAANLSVIPNAPHGITFRLANDTIDVARPILVQSAVLTDSDLIVISEEHGSSHMMAIAQRPYVSSIVSDVLVFRGDDLVRQQIARNDGANISPRGFSRLAGQARTDLSMEQILVARPDLPGVAVHILVRFGSKTIRDQLAPGSTTIKPILGTISPTGRAKDLEDLDFIHARARVEQLSQQGIYGETLLMRFVAEEKLAESMVVLARILGVSLNDVKAWYLDSTPEMLLIAAKAYGIETRSIFGLLGLGRWRITLDARARQAAIHRYQTMPKAHAVKLLGAWRKNRYDKTR